MTDYDKITIAAALGRTTTIHQLTIDNAFSSNSCCLNFILAFPAPEFIMISPFALIAPTTRNLTDVEII